MKLVRLNDYRQYKGEKARAPLGDYLYRNFERWLRWKETGNADLSRLIFLVEDDDKKEER